jgi:hypothetical protein
VIAQQFVGWVERSETHRLSETPPQQGDGFHFVQPILRAARH